MYPTRRLTRQVAARTLAALTVGLVAASCGGGTQVKSEIVFRAADTSQPDNWAFHNLGSNDEVINCTATIDANPDGVFDFKLSREFNVVPVKLSIHLVSRTGDQVTLSASTMQPVLFLENGTALEVVDPETLVGDVPKKKLATFNENLFDGGFLQALGSSVKANGYLFFQLPGDPMREEIELTVAGPDDSAYQVNLRHSLIRFTYERDHDGNKTLKTVNVGTK